jgi:hypothetical protein
MTDLAEARAALKATMRKLPINVQNLVDHPDVPAVIVLPDAPFDWHDVFEDGLNRLRFRVLILVAYGDIDLAQDELDSYLTESGTKSIPAAIEAAGSQFEIKLFQAYDVISLTDGGTRYLTCELIVEFFG